MLDDQRPTLTLTFPQPGKNGPLTRILIGMHDAYTGLDGDSLQVTASVPLDGSRCRRKSGRATSKPYRGESGNGSSTKPLDELAAAKLDVSVKDKQGNTSRIVRTFSVAKGGK